MFSQYKKKERLVLEILVEVVSVKNISKNIKSICQQKHRNVCKSVKNMLVRSNKNISRRKTYQ